MKNKLIKTVVTIYFYNLQSIYLYYLQARHKFSYCNNKFMEYNTLNIKYMCISQVNFS